MSQHYTLAVMRDEQRKSWDCFVSQRADGHLLQSWGWGELKASAGWQPLRLALLDEQQHIVAAAQVLRRAAPRAPLWAGHLAYIPRGPLLDWSQPELSAAFMTRLERQVRRQGALALWIEPSQELETEGGTFVAEHLARLGFHRVQPIQPARTITLDLSHTEEVLLANMKEKWRYNLRLAARRGVVVREAQTLEDVHAWYALLRTTGERDRFGIHTLDYYLRAWLILAPRSQAELLLAEYNGQLLAGIFVGLMAKQAIYLYGASSNEQRQLMPNYLLQWEAMCRARRAGATRYDLWGIPETDAEDEALAGVYRFKRGWGGEIVRFPGCYERIYRPLALNVARRFLRE